MQMNCCFQSGDGGAASVEAPWFVDTLRLPEVPLLVELELRAWDVLLSVTGVSPLEAPVLAPLELRAGDLPLAETGLFSLGTATETLLLLWRSFSARSLEIPFMDLNQSSE